MKKKILAQTKQYELMNGELIVKIKEPTFLDMQSAAQHLIGGNGLSLDEYWRYAFSHWVMSIEPVMTTDDLLNLSPEAGKAVSELLPAPQELVDMLGFTTPQPTSSTTSFMDDQ